MGHAEHDQHFEAMMKDHTLEPPLPQIEVTDRVMARIEDLNSNRNTRLGIRTKKAGFLLAGLTALILLTVSAYAASEWIQISNASGVVKVQYAPPVPRPEQNNYDKYQQHALNMQQHALHIAKPGELIAYLDKGQNADHELHYAYKEQPVLRYDDLLKEMVRTGTPLLPESAVGYAFDKGDLSPYYPNANSTSYRATLAELLHQRKQQTEPQSITAKIVPWAQAGSVHITYSKGNAHLDLGATFLHGGNVNVEQEPTNTPETIKVGNRTIIFNSIMRPINNTVKPMMRYHYITWYNEDQDAYYTLTTYGDHTLDKTQLVKLASQLINDGL